MTTWLHQFIAVVYRRPSTLNKGIQVINPGIILFKERLGSIKYLHIYLSKLLRGKRVGSSPLKGPSKQSVCCGHCSKLSVAVKGLQPKGIRPSLYSARETEANGHLHSIKEQEEGSSQMQQLICSECNQFNHVLFFRLSHSSSVR